MRRRARPESRSPGGQDRLASRRGLLDHSARRRIRPRSIPWPPRRGMAAVDPDVGLRIDRAEVEPDMVGLGEVVEDPHGPAIPGNAPVILALDAQQRTFSAERDDDRPVESPGVGLEPALLAAASPGSNRNCQGALRLSQCARTASEVGCSGLGISAAMAANPKASTTARLQTLVLIIGVDSATSWSRLMDRGRDEKAVRD